MGMLEGLLPLIKDLLFPTACVSCGREGQWCCAPCRETFRVLVVQRCPVCNKQTSCGGVCFVCKGSSELDGITALYDYTENSALARFIKTFKYQFSHDLATELPQILKQVGPEIWKSVRAESGNVVPIPVPLHIRRERERGFNQAELLAKALVQIWQEQDQSMAISMQSSALVRSRFTSPQAHLKGEDRRTNLSGAFVWQGKQSAPERVLLIDDVFTTGSTMQECARELKKHGAKWVWGIALARG